MKITMLFAADIHENELHLAKLLTTAARKKVDAVIIGGDIVPKSLFEELLATDAQLALRAQTDYLRDVMIPVCRKFRSRHPNIRIYADLGNDDFWFPRSLLIEAQKEGILRLLHMCKYPLTPDLDIIGYMKVPPTSFGLKDGERVESKNCFAATQRFRRDGLLSEDAGIAHWGFIDEDPRQTIEADLRRLQRMIKKPFIFVSHCPPYQTKLDMLMNGTHAGSIAIRKFIERWATRGLLKMSLHGHIHESPQVSGSTGVSIHGVLCINPGQKKDKLLYSHCGV